MIFKVRKQSTPHLILTSCLLIMGIARSTLLWISENRTLRETLPKYKFVRSAVSRFMPGEDLADALLAAHTLEKESIGTIFTRLGENVADGQMVKEVVTHYITALRQIREHGLNSYVSVKLTQLGLDLDEDLCSENLDAIVRAAEEVGTWVWIDMEQSPYVDRTLHAFKRIRRNHTRVGICLQAYLHRTERDLNDLLPLHPSVRLVKGAYKESPSVALSAKADVDKNYFELIKKLLKQAGNGSIVGVATHDQNLIGRVQQEAGRLKLAKTAYEFQLLYGIRTDEQRRLAKSGYAIRCLISYGTYWFPWYVRRLAERPANVWFVLKNILG